MIHAVCATYAMRPPMDTEPERRLMWPVSAPSRLLLPLPTPPTTCEEDAWPVPGGKIHVGWRSLEPPAAHQYSGAEVPITTLCKALSGWLTSPALPTTSPACPH